MIINRKNIHVLTYILNADGTFPNSALPLLIYKSALELTPGEIEKLLKINAWENSWRNGVYGYHHYHSTAHEVLCAYDGNATLQFGGEKGIVVLIKKGDVVIIPAGVAHKNLNSSEQFKCIGAYPVGQQYDMNYGKSEELLQTIKNIAVLPLPKTDPVFGDEGPLLNYWKR